MNFFSVSVDNGNNGVIWIFSGIRLGVEMISYQAYLRKIYAGDSGI